MATDPVSGKEIPNENDSIELNDKQQAHVNKLIDQRFSKVSAKHADETKKLQETIDAQAQELETLRNPTGKKKKENEGDGGEEEDITRKKYKDLLGAEERKTKDEERKRQAAEKDRDEAKAESLRIKKENAMAKAAGKSNFYSLEDVMNLTGHMVEFNDDHGRFVIKGADGKPMENSKLEPMTLEEFYTKFAAERPYLVNGDVMGGTGSVENTKHGSALGLVKSKADVKTAKEKSDYIDKFGYGAWETLPLK